MSDDMLGDIDGATVDGDVFHGMFHGHKYQYINGVRAGKESLIKAFDVWQKTTDGNTTEETIDSCGDFVWELLRRSSDIDEDTARLLATPEQTKELALLWWQRKHSDL